jgi:hypothetical protein
MPDSAIPVQQPPQTVIEIRPFKGGWQCFERPGVARWALSQYRQMLLLVLDDIVHSSRLLQDYLSLERGSPQDSQGLTETSSAAASGCAHGAGEMVLIM